MCEKTYCDVMKRKPWRAVSFDWDFGVSGGENSPTLRAGIYSERQNFERMLKKLKFNLYPDNQNEKIKLTRQLSKKKFLEELRKFKKQCVEERCGCILVSVSSHGVIRKTSAQSGEEDVDTYEDYILTHPDPDKDPYEYSDDFVDERVAVREIVEVFRDPNLKGIPKIFFIQACRSEDESSKSTDLGIPFVVCDSEGVDQGISGVIPPKPDEKMIVYSPPCIDDSVIVFSTPLGYIAGFESSETSGKGSRVWTELEKKMNKSPSPVKLLDLLKETNRELSQSKYEIKIKDKTVNYKPLLSICYTLTKHIVFETK